MSEKHSPGPWTVHGGTVRDKNGNAVAMAPATTAWPGEWPADARLIAAAPELLRLLKAARKDSDWRWAGDADDLIRSIENP